MQSDSMQFSASGHIKEACNQTVTQQSPNKCFQCSKCVLIFKSKVYLFEHLNKVHGLDVKAALRGAGLKSAETYKASTDKKSSRGSGKCIKCQHCGFKACNLEALTEHKKQCKKDDLNLSGTSSVSEIPEIGITVTSSNVHNEAAEEMPSIVSVISLSEAQSPLGSPKHLKTYKRPSQTITKYFARDSGSNGKPSATVTDETEGTLILQDSSCSPNKDGVFKVIAKSNIDIDNYRYYRFLGYEHLPNTDLASMPKEKVEEPAHNNLGKRAKNESSKGPLPKKAKLKDEKAKVPESKSPSTQHSSSAEFSFEVSDEEVHEAPRNQKVYFCKHCDYSNVSFSDVSFHYQSNHPFVRCKAAYIHNPNVQSATFRCLTCPVEFESTIDLKWHYVEYHPETPDIFKMKPTDFLLAFKCFECPHTHTNAKDLRLHYKTNHPTFDVGNSLLFYKYSVNECQEEPPQLKTCEKTLSPERSGEITPEKAKTPSKEAENTPPQHSTPKGSDMALHQCSKCEFAHKSVVVMHVHYQKNHPDEALTIPKIKELTRVASHAASQLTPVKESCEKTEDKPEPSQPKRISLSVPEHKPEEPKSHSSPETRQVKSAEDESKTKALPRKSIREKSTGKDDFSSNSPGELMYCQFCNYTNISLKSVVGHHCAKHSMIASVSKEDIISYSAEIRKKKLESEAPLKTDEQVKVCSETEADGEQDDVADVSGTQDSAYLHAEKLFYCQECNFGNRSVIGVLNHQNKVHKIVKANSDAVLEYTALIRDEIEKSKSLAQGSSSSTRLPLPFINEGDEDKFFCPLCNYRHGSLAELMRHCSVRHQGFKAKGDIQKYTSKVLKQAGKLQLRTAVNQEVKQVEKKEEKKKKLAKSVTPPADPAPASLRDSNPSMILPCYKCSYTTKYFYLLKNHLFRSHQSNRSVTDLFRTYFRQGLIQSGYHCHRCGFTHKKAMEVFKHFQKQHPKYRASFDFVKRRLYVGPDSVAPKRKNGQKKRPRRGDGSLATQRSGQKEAETHVCSACSHISGSKSDLDRHYQTAHPGLSKETGSDLQNGKKASAWSQADDLDEMPGLFEAFQVPLEDPEEVISSSTAFKCASCPAHFSSEHGLITHCGMRRHNPLNGQEALKQQTQSQTRLHVFNCPHCAYINTTYQGVLTHCQMKHPSRNSRVESLHVDITNLRNQEKFKKKYQSGGTLKFSGFLCKTCPQFCKTLDKLNKHKVKHLIKTKPSTVTEDQKKTAPETEKTDKSLKTQGSASKTLLLSKKASEKCSHCSFSCNTKIVLKQHMFIQHKEAVSKDFVRKCELCPRFYFSKVRLGRHYSKRHGKNAYLKYFASVYKQPSKKSASPDQPSTRQPQNDAADAKKEVYKCPCCTYVNASRHGMLTHCLMKHPDVLVEAERLKKMEILVANMIKCSLGKSSNERGYLCEKCPQIHASLSRLKIHGERDHERRATSNLPAQTETQNQPGISAQGSVLEACASVKKTSEASIREAVPSLSAPETGPSKSVSVEKKKVLYECQKCTYTALHRKHLRCHYRSTHKLDARNTYKLMEKYNMYKCNYLPRCAEPDKRAKVRCKSCPDSTFDSSQLLIAHYNTHHSVVCESDFIVISPGLKWKTTGVYKCAHCMTVLNGTKILRRHLERHKSNMVETAKGTKEGASPDFSAAGPKSTKLRLHDAPPQQDVTSAETVTSPPSPQLSPSKVTDVEPEVEDKEERHPCKQCRRTFMSLRGLRSHESSHAAMAAIMKDNLATSQLSIYNYVLHKSGTKKPFRCGCCAYRTNVLGLWRSHFIKNHQDVVQKDDIVTDKAEITQLPSGEPSDTVEEINTLPESEDELEETERSLYLEPPDVQRQLNQYSLMAHTSDKSNETVQDSALPEAGLLDCEFCNFKSEHPSSIRRHYLNRHGKKILRCKDCSFFTGLQKTLDVHMETGHSTCQSEPTHQKDLRCPFCLYQTKNKNNMIDHIVLHREERVVPIEVRRPKLSRYLQGIVFRCHQCTFSSGSTENLRLHMMRHEDIKPYKCRLCYFDCTQLGDLEAHLSDKHQVLRNHELVGQVSLDQLEARTETTSSEKREHNNGSDDAESEEYFTDCDEYPQTANQTENDGSEKMSTQAHEKDEQGKNKESPTKGSIIDNAEPNTSVQKDHEKDPQTQVEITALHHTAGEQSVAEGNHPETQDEDCSGPEKEEQADENQDEHKENPADEKAQDHKPHLKISHHRILDIEARVEDDILDHILQLDGDGSMYKIHKRADQMRTDKEEQNTEAQAIDLSLHKNEQNPRNPVETNSVSASPKTNKPKAPGSFTFERHLLTLSPNCVRLKLSHQDSSAVSFAICKREQKQNLINYSEATESCAQTPGLENEYVKEEVNCFKTVEEEEETGHLEQKQDKEEDVNIGPSSQDQHTPPVIRDVQPATNGAAEVLNDENRFTCEFCGRTFTTFSELDRHVMRHGM